MDVKIQAQVRKQNTEHEITALTSQEATSDITDKHKKLNKNPKSICLVELG